MSDETKASLTVLIVMGLICASFVLTHFFHSKADKRVTSGKQFIINNASYKCIKTNELIRGGK